MACRDAYKMLTTQTRHTDTVIELSEPSTPAQIVNELIFGVDSKVKADTILQNNLTEFDWVTRNKVYPAFWGRNLTGESCLTKDEIEFIHSKGCKIAIIYHTENLKATESQGKDEASIVLDNLDELDIPNNIAVFLEIDDCEKISSEYMKGFAKVIIANGYVPGFKANTDARFCFDREFSRGVQKDRNLFLNCLVWAVAPSLAEYDGITTTHLIHPDNWIPFAPSGITRHDIAVWQYGKDCHPIQDNFERATVFNINLVRNQEIIFEKMF